MVFLIVVYNTQSPVWNYSELKKCACYIHQNTVFSICLENFPPFWWNSKLMTANTFTLEVSKICPFWKRLNDIEFHKFFYFLYNIGNSSMFTKPRHPKHIQALTLSQTSPGLYVYQYVGQVFWKNCGKGEIAHNEQFLLFPRCFLPVWRTFCHFHQI